MIQVNASQLANTIEYLELIDALEKAFVDQPKQPLRHHHSIQVPKKNNGTLLVMPAWLEGAFMGIKLVTIFPDNTKDTPKLPSVIGQYLLMDATTGELLALIDGTELTLRRTAAASALAAKYLACADTNRLLMVGSGALARHLVQAHSKIRPIKEVIVWSQKSTNAEKLAYEITNQTHLTASATSDLKSACEWAQLISCATLSTSPLVRGRWLSPGTHLDLVGAFNADMQETDAEAIARSNLYVDTMQGALSEAGDIIKALNTGVISESNIKGEMKQIINGQLPGRTNKTDITCFKSVGAALEDLAAATLAYKKLTH